MYQINYLNKDKIKKIGNYILIASTSTLLLLTGCENKDKIENDELFINITHADSLENPLNEGNVSLYFSDITDKDLEKLSADINHLQLEHCYFLHNLDKLPELCPNIKVLKISHCPSVIDLSFIYDLPNLEIVELNNCPGVTRELRDYLNNHNIENNITQNDIYAAEQIDKIYNHVIKDDMSDEEKIKAITLYIIDNFEYDEDYEIESNLNPLVSMTFDYKGVCAGYAYLADALLCKAGINSYYVINKEHAWNLIEEDDKYYYLDTTYLDANDAYGNIKYFDNYPTYMSSPAKIGDSSMSAYNAGDKKIIMPKEFVEDIEAGEDLKTLKEKYRGDCVVYWLNLFIPTLIVLGLASGTLYFEVKAFLKEQKQAKKEKEDKHKKRF